MDHVAYPETLPLACVLDMGRILRDRKIMEEKVVFAEHFWNVQGYAQRVLLGTSEGNLHSAVPIEVEMAGCEPSSAQLGQLIKELEQHVDENADEENTASFGASSARAGLNPIVIGLLTRFGPLLIGLLKDLLLKKQSAEGR